MKTVFLTLALVTQLLAQSTLAGHAKLTPGASAATSATLSYTPASAHNILTVACIGYRSGGGAPATHTISDGIETYTQKNTIHSANQGNSTVYVYEAHDISAGAHSIVCTWDIAVFWNIMVMEFTGPRTYSGDGSNATAGTDNVTLSSGNVTTTNASDVLVAFWGTNNGGAVTFNASGGGFTTVDTSLDGGCCSVAGDAYQITSSTGTYGWSVTYSSGGGSQGWGATINAFAGSNPAPAVVPKMTLLGVGP